MKGTNGWLKWLAVVVRTLLWDKFCNALLHLTRRLVGKGDSQDILRRNTTADHVPHAISERARLARASASEDKYGALNGDGSLALLRI